MHNANNAPFNQYLALNVSGNRAIRDGFITSVGCCRSRTIGDGRSGTVGNGGGRLWTVGNGGSGLRTVGNRIGRSMTIGNGRGGFGTVWNGRSGSRATGIG